MKRSDWIACLLALAILFMGGMWLADVSVGAMLVGSETGGLWWVRDPFVSYHIGLLLALFSTLAVLLIAVHHVIKD
jgi:hypothetical protein